VRGVEGFRLPQSDKYILNPRMIIILTYSVKKDTKIGLVSFWLVSVVKGYFNNETVYRYFRYFVWAGTNKI